MHARTLSLLSLTFGPSLSLLAAPAVAAPAVLPHTAAFEDLPVASSEVREFDIELPRSERTLAWRLSSGRPAGRLSGSIMFSATDGQPLDEQVLDGLPGAGGLVPAPVGTVDRRIRITLRGGQEDMRVSMALSPVTSPLRSGQVVPVFARRAGSDAWSETYELKLSKASDVDIVTWGGEAAARLIVTGATAGGVSASHCDDVGDAWRRCRLQALGAGSYRVALEGEGSPVNLLATWQAAATP